MCERRIDPDAARVLPSMRGRCWVGHQARGGPTRDWGWSVCVLYINIYIDILLYLDRKKNEVHIATLLEDN